MELKDRPKIISLLNVIVNKVAQTTIKEGCPMALSKKDTYVGSVLVQKLDDGTYTISKADKPIPIYSDIYLYESAILIARYYDRGSVSIIREILKVDKECAKHKTDMMHYIACYKQVKQTRDTERMLVLEDKFCMSEESLKITRSKLSRFTIPR
jgi:hypothetical protein